METGLVSNIQRFSLHDGPGIRTTVFLKGCPLKCLWCHNPENLAAQAEVVIASSRCISCERCSNACPNGALKKGCRSDDCSACGSCVEVCPTTARQMAGRCMTTPELMRELAKDILFFDDSGGGATFSGGEPLSQPKFLIDMLTACREREVHTAVDTCGYASCDTLLEVAALADLILYDLKAIDDEKHHHLTGVSNRVILDNLRRLGNIHQNIWIRIPVIPGLNDAPEELFAAAKFIASLSGVRRVNLLPYHKIGADKFQRIGQTYSLAHLEPPTMDRMRKIAEEFVSLGLDVRVGG